MIRFARPLALFFAALIVILVGSAPSAEAATSYDAVKSLQLAPQLYLGQWEWFEDESHDYWRAPGGDAIGLYDLRSLPQMGKAGGMPEGYGLFAYQGTRLYPQLELLLGPDLKATLTLAQRSGLASRLDVFITATQLGEVLRELTLLDGDPTGLTGWKPIRGSLNSPPGLKIGGFGQIFSERFNSSHPAFTNSVEVFQADYRRNRTLVSNADELDDLRRWTGKTMLKLGIEDVADLLPPEHRDDGSLDPATTFTDNFADTNGVQIEDHTPTGGGFAWLLLDGGMEIQDNECRIDFTATNAHIVSDTGTSDDAVHVEGELEGNSTAVNLFPGLITRKHATLATEDYYRAYINPRLNTVTLDKVVTGSGTQLDQQSVTINANVQYFMEYEVTAGDDHTVDIDTTNHITLNDTSVTGNTKFGMKGRSEGGARSFIDDFSINDLGAAARQRAIIISWLYTQKTAPVMTRFVSLFGSRIAI